MTKVIACVNQKGGVGKTTTCVNLAAALENRNQQVLLIDLDPQGNATMGSGINKHQLEYGSRELLLGEVDCEQAILSADPASYHLIGANITLTQAEVALLDIEGREFRLKHAIANILSEFDYVLIDCPPSLNMLTINALVAANSVLIPMQCEYYALEGLGSLLDTISSIQESANADLQIEGIIRTMYDSRNKLTGEVSDQLYAHFPEKVLTTVIPRNVRLAEAPSHGMPVSLYDKKSQGSAAYTALAGEIIRHNTHPEQELESQVATREE